MSSPGPDQFERLHSAMSRLIANSPEESETGSEAAVRWLHEIQGDDQRVRVQWISDEKGWGCVAQRSFKKVRDYFSVK